MIKRLPDTLPDATCADPATPTACTGRDGDHAERWQAGGDGQVRTGPVDDEPPTFDLSTAGGIARYVRNIAREAVAAEVARSPVSMRDAQPEPAQVADPGEDTEAVRRFLEGETVDDIYPALRLGASEVEAQIREALFDARVRARALEADVARRQESTDEQICAAEARTRAREYEADVDALSAEVERLQAEVDRLSGRTAASELARLSREAREVRQALDMPDGTHAAVVAAIAGMRGVRADLLAREAAPPVSPALAAADVPSRSVVRDVRTMTQVAHVRSDRSYTWLREFGHVGEGVLGVFDRVGSDDDRWEVLARDIPDAQDPAHLGGDLGLRTIRLMEGEIERLRKGAPSPGVADGTADLAAAVRDFVGGVSYPGRPVVPRSPEQAAAPDRVDDEPACAGDEIDAREVRPGSVVLHEPTDYFGNTVTVRLAGGNGWHCKEPDAASDGEWRWPGDCGFDRCRELATALSAKECAEVAALDAAGAVAWCGARAARLATEAVGEELPRIVGWSDLRPGDLAWDGFAPAGCRALLARLSREHHAWICEDGRVEVDHGRPCSAYGEECVLVARGMSDNPLKVLEPARAAWAAVREIAEALPEIREAHARSAELAARAQAFDAARALPRVVEWADLQPGDLALDADASVQLWRQDGKRSGSWRANNGTRVSGTRDGVDTSPDHVMSRRAILLARGVPKRASAISAAWEAIRSQAERLADQARKEGA